MTMEIIPSEIQNHSIVKLKNEMKEKFTVSALINNYGEDRQNAIWRGGVSIKTTSKESDTESINFFIALDANNSDGLGGIGPEVIIVRFSESLVPCMASSIED